MDKKAASIQFITQDSETQSHLDAAKVALEAGSKWIQLRMKNVDTDWVKNCAHMLMEMCSAYNAHLILNDYVALASEIGCFGVHVGQEDISVPKARKILQDNQIIGCTAHTLGEMIDAAEDGADYIGLGPFRFTQTKDKLRPVLGLEGIAERIADFRSSGYNTPIVVVGGVGAEDALLIKGCGADGIAFSSALLDSKRPKEMIKNLKKVWA